MLDEGNIVSPHIICLFFTKLNDNSFARTKELLLKFSLCINNSNNNINNNSSNKNLKADKIILFTL